MKMKLYKAKLTTVNKTNEQIKKRYNEVRNCEGEEIHDYVTLF